jgi:transcriptional regulator with XRE-family HTH domain
MIPHKKGGPKPIDIYIGNQIRQQRVRAGKSQEWLGQQIGKTFQQVQKYERGANRVSAGVLLEIAGVLGLSILIFYPTPESPTAPLPAADRETIELVRTYQTIPSPRLRSQLRAIAKIFATPAERSLTWQPIDTAPKNGTRIFLAGPEGPFKNPSIGRWEEDKYAEKPNPYWTNDLISIYGIREVRNHQPTQWQPLPEPPVPEVEA